MSKEPGHFLAKRKDPIEPTQGKRLSKETLPYGDVAFTIKGEGVPGFFVLFGLMFGGIASLFLALFWGTSTRDNGTTGNFPVSLFLIPFFIVGVSTFLLGIYLWLGTSKLTIGQHEINLERSLFGIGFWQKRLSRTGLGITFQVSHENNEIPFYKLSLSDGAKNTSIGGSLKEAQLLWLERELKSTLGLEARSSTSVTEAIQENIMAETPIPDYRSKNLKFSSTPGGWEAQSKTTLLGSLGVILFGSVFLTIGLLMHDSTRRFLLDFVPQLRDALPSSGGGPPIGFAIIFGLVGLLVILLGLFLLGFRLTISRNHSQLVIARHWTIFSTSQMYEISDLMDLQLNATGHINNDPRYQLTGIFKDGKKARLTYFASANEVGQIQAHLRADMKGTLTKNRNQ